MKTINVHEMIMNRKLAEVKARRAKDNLRSAAFVGMFVLFFALMVAVLLLG